MEVVPLTPPMDFNFDSNCSSPFITAPSSPQRFNNSGFFFSAPTSPTRVTSSFFFNDSPSSSVPFHWEQKPGVPKPNANHHHHDDDFEFDFSGQLDPPSLSADELFHAGKIRPLKPPPGLQSSSPVTSPRCKNKDLDPFAEAIKETRRREQQDEKKEQDKKPERERERERGRERVSLSPSVSRKGTRSLSPLRISDIVCDSDDKNVSSSTSNTKSSFLSSIPFTRKWRFRDFLLFRSASEGRASDKDPLRKYVVLSKNEDVRNSSFRSTDNSGSVSKRRVSAHELHYTLNRAASEEMKKKTLLPYKQGLLGCLGFNPGMHHISKGVGSLTRS
ncbi:hypothetical protein VNO78_12131 [Psophocarpus tetragonolobus]|uniref:Calmodulin-binding protein n=1 Tax=Psophocarpus tetragonolobus TaxID=3891 RepID=A0AAN9XP59_PSOTE